MLATPGRLQSVWHWAECDDVQVRFGCLGKRGYPTPREWMETPEGVARGRMETPVGVPPGQNG